MKLWRRLIAREDAAEEAAKLRVAYRQTFNTPQGREVLADILRSGGVHRTGFVAGDPYMSAFHEGQRRLALHVVEMLNSDPDAVANMLREGDTQEVFNERSTD